MKVQSKKFSVNRLYRIVLSGLLALTLFSATAGSGLAPVQAYADPGTIAYVRDNDVTGDEIRLIEPDGSKDRLLWRTNVPDLPELYQISSVAWNPSASELAFASRHEEACSFYNSDIYTIRADGSAYRRFTAPPACGTTSSLPKGTVNVNIENWTDGNGPFVVYFEGAPAPKSITLAPGTGTTVSFTNVADFGSFKQWATVIFGELRFMSAGANADVKAGTTVTTGGLLMSYGYKDWGWTGPTWKSDGSQISYVFNGQTPYTMTPDNTAAGMIGQLLFNIPIGSFPYYVEGFTWAPPGPRANQVLYSAWPQDLSGEYIWLGTAGSSSPGDALVDIGEDLGQALLGLVWLPDSSGFLFSKTESFNEYANIFKYSFDTNSVTRLTSYTSGYPRNLSVSPDGAHVVYEYQATGNWYDLQLDLDLYLMDRYGNGRTLFVENARVPAWSPVAVPGPVVKDHFVYVPSVRH